MFEYFISVRNILILLLPFFFPMKESAAQSETRITGKVIDQQTRIPLDFVSVRINNKAIGTITNADGVFDLLVPREYGNDTLIISLMGYASYRCVVKKIADRAGMTIKLKVKAVELGEITITDSKLDPKEIVRKAYEQIESNFSVTPYYYNAFYRETHQENNRYVSLVDAAMDIYDRGYKAIREKRWAMKEEVSLNEVRVSRNYRNPLFRNTEVERYNLVISALRCNEVKYRKPNVSAMLRNKKFVLDSIIYQDDRPVCIISFFTYIPKYPLFERKNTFYIDAENYAIYKIGWEEYAKKGKYSEKPWPLTKDSPYRVARKRISTIYEYENFQGKMYLKYFNEQCDDDILDAGTNAVLVEATGRTTLIVTSVYSGKPKQEGAAMMKNDRSLYAQATPYNSVFWKEHQQLVPLTKKQLADLEHKIPIDEQFRSHLK
jgi:hypothetical protein